mmetsp:Transcript_36937/g.44136  ORF Transcript_36937/g.44136 Transcript_36937/m.44136 type:complete len:261 (+) Transcript_36937:941-1723(+)
MYPSDIVPLFCVSSSGRELWNDCLTDHGGGNRCYRILLGEWGSRNGLFSSQWTANGIHSSNRINTSIHIWFVPILYLTKHRLLSCLHLGWPMDRLLHDHAWSTRLQQIHQILHPLHRRNLQRSLILQLHIRSVLQPPPQLPPSRPPKPLHALHLTLHRPGYLLVHHANHFPPDIHLLQSENTKDYQGLWSGSDYIRLLRVKFNAVVEKISSADARGAEQISVGGWEKIVGSVYVGVDTDEVVVCVTSSFVDVSVFYGSEY